MLTTPEIVWDNAQDAQNTIAIKMITVVFIIVPSELVDGYYSTIVCAVFDLMAI